MTELTDYSGIKKFAKVSDRPDDEDNHNDAATDLVDDGKGLDANRYATKKTVAQGMLDIALLTSNASQLKYVLQVGPKHEFYHMLLILISLSIVLQVVSAIICGILGFIYDINHVSQQRRADMINNIALFFRGFSSSVNVFLNVFYGLAYGPEVIRY